MVCLTDSRWGVLNHRQGSKPKMMDFRLCPWTAMLLLSLVLVGCNGHSLGQRITLTAPKVSKWTKSRTARATTTTTTTTTDTLEWLTTTRGGAQTPPPQSSDPYSTSSSSYYGGTGDSMYQPTMQQQQQPQPHFEDEYPPSMLPQESVQDRVDAWKRKQQEIYAVNSVQKESIRDVDGRVKLVATVSKASRAFIFFILLWRDVYLYEVADTFLSGTLRLVTVLPLCLLFLSNLAGMVTTFTSPHHRTKKRLKAILNLDKVVEIVLMGYHLGRLTLFSQSQALKEPHIAGILHSVVYFLQCQACTRLTWDDTKSIPTTNNQNQHYTAAQQQPFSSSSSSSSPFQQQQQQQQQYQNGGTTSSSYPTYGQGGFDAYYPSQHDDDDDDDDDVGEFQDYSANYRY